MVGELRMPPKENRLPKMSHGQRRMRKITGVLRWVRLDGGGPPEELAAIADATWGDDPVYGLIITAFGGAINHTLRSLHLLFDSSTESEAVATGKAGEALAYAREVFRGLGVDMSQPTVVGTDNMGKPAAELGRGSADAHEALYSQVQSVRAARRVRRVYLDPCA